MNRAAVRVASALAGAGLMLVLWWIAAEADLVNQRLFPGPIESIQAIGEGLSDKTLLTDVRATLTRVVTALGLAIVFAVPLGILLGACEPLYRILEFPIDFFRSTPVTALLPFFLLLFGIGDGAKVAVGAFAAGLLILFNVAYGVMAARPTRKQAALVMGAGRLRTLGTVTVFEALPQTFVGLRTGSSLALVCIVVAEMFIGADDGIGRRIIDAQQTYNLADVYGSIIVAGVIGFAINALLSQLDTRLVHWTGR